MKAMMSDKLRDILKDPKRAKELQKKLAGSPSYLEQDKHQVSITKKSFTPEQSSKHFK